MSARKPTMKDVAARAGVSVMTVSYALRGYARLSRETTERVRAVAAEMGYTPHPLVSALIKEIRSRRKVMAPPVIAYISSYARRNYWMINPIQRDYFEGAKRRCEELGFAFALYELSKYQMSGERLSRALKYANVCGLAVGPVPTPGPLDLDWEAFPSVAFGHSMSHPRVHRVTVNHWQSMQLVLQRLTEKGYTRIATGTTSSISKRIGGIFVAGMDAYLRGIPPARRIPVLLHPPQRPALMRRWLEKHRPDVFIDQSPYLYHRLITEAGWAIPEKMAYVTLSWHPGTPEWAGLDQNSFHVGKAAVDVLVGQIHDNRRGVPEIPSFTMIDGSWVDGPSAPVRKESPR